MPIRDLESTFVTEEDSRLYASQQILLFLSVPEDHDDHQPFTAKERARESLVPFDKIPPDAFSNNKGLFRWTTRPIYDIDGLLLFRDQTLSLGPGEELHVRTAASELLRTPVWSVRAGPAVDIDLLLNKALSIVKETKDLEPVMVGHEETPRLICYNYPKLGFLCRSKKRPGVRFVFDLWERQVIPADFDDIDTPLEYVRMVWSPFDYVTRGKRAHLREGFGDNVASLPRLPERIEDLIAFLEEAGRSIEQWKITDPRLELESQQTHYYCAAATAKMILDFYGIRTAGANIELTQDQIYAAMGDGESGALPKQQVSAIPILTGNTLTASLDVDPVFTEAAEEILNDRPFKTGTAGHAKACGGFLLEVSGKQWLYIYDPYPANEGCVYYEAWEIGYYLNYMYVQRA